MSKQPIIVFEGIEGSGKSYHINNILGEAGSLIDNYEQVPIHKYLKVQWQFRN